LKSVGQDLAEPMRRETESFAACAAAEDFSEGVRAFLEKRPASFRGTF
jgi:enoyl-CoA hydratase/carnithine racemase